MDEAQLREKLKNGPLTRDDVLAILSWQLSLPAEEMDCALISECDLFLDPDGPRLSEAREDALLAAILGRIDAGTAGRPASQHKARARGAHRRPLRKAAIAALLALALLALAVAGVAYGYRRGVLNFTEGFGFAGMVSQPGADALVTSGALAHVELAHVTVDVLEAVYDGAELRVVYALTSPDGLLHPAEHAEGYEMPGAAEGDVTMCDFLRVNGQDVYLDNTWEAPGDVPGQMLYYLQTNLNDWGVDVSGAETLTLGLPLYPGEGGVSSTLDFAIPAAVPEGLVKTASLVSCDMGGLTASVTASAFSPLNGYIRVRIDRLTRERYNVDFAQRCEIRTVDGAPLTDCRIRGMEFGDGYAEFGVTITPTEEAWPEELVVAFLLTDGQSDWTVRVRLE